MSKYNGVDKTPSSVSYLSDRLSIQLAPHLGCRYVAAQMGMHLAETNKGDLDDEELAFLEGHIAGCESCRKLYAQTEHSSSA